MSHQLPDLQLKPPLQFAGALMGHRMVLRPWNAQIVSWSGWVFPVTNRPPGSRCVARSIRREEKMPLA